MSSTTIEVAQLKDIDELIELMRIYCDNSDEPHVPKPKTEDLVRLVTRIIENSNTEGIYLIARQQMKSIGFASLFWSWSFTHHPGRRALLSDLFVHPDARGLDVAGLLIRACENQARQQCNIRSIVWQTAIENRSAQKTYQRFGVIPKPCIDYEIDLH